MLDIYPYSWLDVVIGVYTDVIIKPYFKIMYLKNLFNPKVALEKESRWEDALIVLSLHENAQA